MSAPANKFAAALEAAFLVLLQSPDAQIPASVKPKDREQATRVALVTAKTEDLAVCPRVVVKAGPFKEAIFQSGIYRGPVELCVYTDIDTAAAQDANRIFGRCVDVMQWVDLVTRLRNTGLVFIHGTGDINLVPNETFGDRQWAESVNLEVTGYAVS